MLTSTNIPSHHSLPLIQLTYSPKSSLSGLNCKAFIPPPVTLHHQTRNLALPVQSLQSQMPRRRLTLRHLWCYVVEGESEITVLLSARPAKGDGLKVVTDKVFLARSSDGAASFSFEGWIIPLSDPYRAVMPAITLVSPTEWVVALRRREVDDPTRDAWIDVCRTTDRG